MKATTTASKMAMTNVTANNASNVVSFALQSTITRTHTTIRKNATLSQTVIMHEKVCVVKFNIFITKSLIITACPHGLVS